MTKLIQVSRVLRNSGPQPDMLPRTIKPKIGTPFLHLIFARTSRPQQEWR